MELNVEGTSFDVFSKDRVQETLRAIVEGVAEGRFEETRWERWGMTTKTRGVVRLREGRDAISSTRSPIWLLLRGRKSLVRYGHY